MYSLYVMATRATREPVYAARKHRPKCAWASRNFVPMSAARASSSPIGERNSKAKCENFVWTVVFGFEKAVRMSVGKMG